MMPSLCITSLRLEHLGKVLFLSGEWLPTNQTADYVEKGLSALPNWTSPSCRWTMWKRETQSKRKSRFGGTKCEGMQRELFSAVLFCLIFLNDWAGNWLNPTLEAHPHCSDTGHIQYPKPNRPMFGCLPCRKSKLFINNIELFHSLLKLNFH